MGGTASAVAYGGAIATSAVAGFVTLGIGPVVGLFLTAGALGITGIGGTVITHVNASKYANDEEAFKAGSAIFRKFVNHGKNSDMN